ncbi:hypothetical protein TNCV_4415101 [Trichonephila clavipes]|uniref:Uncharacterized protein n=1 Tax=Trichonephila clavipes TaxID=2585209 RepID=A0A8X6S7S5_TRICX|nr:hypothetical protein TNCV_4415101 [Trichonephila clavipes]
MNETTRENNSTQQQERTTQHGSRNETTQLVSMTETTQLCIAVDRLHRLYSRIGFFYLLRSSLALGFELAILWSRIRDPNH